MTMEAYHAQMAAIRDRFVARVGSAVDDLQTIFLRLQQGAPRPDDLSSLHRGLHDLSGTAPALGFVEIGAAAQQLELILARDIKNAHALGAADLRNLSEGLAALRQLASTAKAQGDSHSVMTE